MDNVTKTVKRLNDKKFWNNFFYEIDMKSLGYWGFTGSKKMKTLTSGYGKFKRKTTW